MRVPQSRSRFGRAGLALAAGVVIIGLQPVATVAQDEPIPSVRFASNGAVTDLSQVNPNIATYQVRGLTGGLLYRFAADGSIQPDLVESSELSDDGLTLTMTLLPDLAYSDGTPVRAQDAVVAWENLLEAPGVNRTLITAVDSVEALDDRTLVWTFSRPSPDVEKWFGFGWLRLDPQEIVASDPDYWLHPVSAGPYVLTEYTPGAPNITMTANDSYPRGPMAVEELQWRFVPDLTSRSLQFANGELDIAQDLPAPALEQLPDDSIKSPSGIGGQILILVNTAQAGPLADPNVRKAISLAIDRDRIVQAAWLGGARPSTSFIYPGFDFETTSLPNGGVRDVEQAKELLAAANVPEGTTLRLGTFGTRAGFRETAAVVRENLAEIGIDAAIEPLDDAVALANLAEGNFDLQIFGGGGFPPVPIMWYYQNLVEGGPFQNWTKYSDPELQGLLEAAAAETDPAAQAALFEQIEQQAAQGMPVIPINERIENHAWYPSVDGIVGFVPLSQWVYVAPAASASG